MLKDSGLFRQRLAGGGIEGGVLPKPIQGIIVPNMGMGTSAL